MRNDPRFQQARFLNAILIILAIGALIGFTVTARIVQKEGWNGLWDRKKDFIRSTVPGSEPALNAADEALRQSPRRQ